jgi:hypothetical protein
MTYKFKFPLLTVACPLIPDLQITAEPRDMFLRDIPVEEQQWNVFVRALEQGCVQFTNDSKNI